MTEGVKYTECYLVDLSYRNDTGELITKEDELVVIYLDNGEISSTNHDLAEKKIEERYPGCKVHSVRLM